MAPPGAGKTELAEYIHSKEPNSIIINKNNFVKDKIQFAEEAYYQTINNSLLKIDCVIVDSQTVLYQDRLELFSHINTEDLFIIGV